MSWNSLAMLTGGNYFFGKFPIWDEMGPKAKDYHGGTA